MPPLRSTPLTVNAEWLAGNIGKPGIKVLDATSHLPTSGRNAKEEHLACRIAGAGWFDIDKIADKSSKLPHTLPSADFFQSKMQALGIENDDYNRRWNFASSNKSKNH